ncbi:hypothetical protein EK0264_07280 [Epidermidibacterium keratini]|uniref:Uncharacterized protein n=1 Tax=Epidermidibacterium keratini TaxID=1891644 RepID=A0A7L4YLM8_9ACTN|nr:hypothetical protein [Epidermidibacterium keratini]QHC00096.1 hypothetical protein EK0264_07280 [Epidermidibacterium keratini]
MAAQRGGRRGLSEIALLVVCLVLGGVALWGAGVLDSAIAREVRVSNAYVEDGVEIDEAEAEQIIGNRNLVVIYLDGELGSRGSDVCDAVSSAAAGSFVAIVDEQMRMYGCSLMPGEDESDEFGKGYVAETTMRTGIRSVADDPIQATRVLASNFDGLVRAGIAPESAREITVPYSRYLIAGIALGTVVIGALLVYLRGRVLGHRRADQVEGDIADRGLIAQRDAALAATGVRLLELDATLQDAFATPEEDRLISERLHIGSYERMTKEYVELNAEAAGDEPSGGIDDQLDRIEAINEEATRVLTQRKYS